MMTSPKSPVSQQSCPITIRGVIVTSLLTVVLLLLTLYNFHQNAIYDFSYNVQVHVPPPPPPDEYFRETNITRVLLLGYGRGGSSFTGELFNQNKQASFWYEPDDAFFSYLAGFLTWRHATELYYPDVTPRRLSDAEQWELTTFLDAILYCDLSNIPTEVLAHFKGLSPKMKFSKSFAQCLTSVSAYSKKAKCQSYLKTPCNYLLNNDKNDCVAMLDNARSEAYDSDFAADSEHTSIFDTYVACMSSVRSLIMSKCSRKFRTSCLRTKIRSAKLLRVHVGDVEQLIRMYPDIKIVHLLRDPRGIINSEMHAKKTRYEAVSKYEKLGPGEKLYQNEARYICAKMLTDYQEREKLQLKYPGVFLTEKYEDIAVDPVQKAQEIYQFIGQDMPEDLAKWLYDSTHAKANNGAFNYQRVDANATAYAWLTRGEEYRREVGEICREFLETAGYVF